MARKKKEETFDVESIEEPVEEPALGIFEQDIFEEEPVVEPEEVEEYGPEHADLVVDQAAVKLWRKKAFLRPEGAFSQVKFEK